MATTLKEHFFGQAFWDELGANLKHVLPRFDGTAFQKEVCDAQWPQLELKQRVRRVARALKAHLPSQYPKAVGKLADVARYMRAHQSSFGFGYLFLADFVEEFGLDDPDVSLQAMEDITQVMSCEFALRPFWVRYPEKVHAQVMAWTGHPSEHVRRLASEGSRPRLPWGMALKFLQKDPAPILPILERLKSDPSEYVRRSVANNLNDISKDHPGLALKIAGRWKGESPETDRLIKHALRGLLKAGNETALGLFGFVELKDVVVNTLRCQPRVKIGEDWEFSFELAVGGKKAQQLRLEFGMDYLKANGKANRKIFQIKEAVFEPGKYPIAKRHSFLERTTRKHYRGRHAVAVLVNGTELGMVEFEVE
jgi:3-methyladenine DNA glycosylase AlkC